MLISIKRQKLMFPAAFVVYSTQLSVRVTLESVVSIKIYEKYFCLKLKNMANRKLEKSQ